MINLALGRLKRAWHSACSYTTGVTIMTSRTRHWLCILPVMFVLVSLNGCQYFCTYWIRGTVQNAVDGTPIAGATVELKSGGRPVYGMRGPIATTSNGRFATKLETSETSGDDWTIVVSADGFRTETIPLGHIEVSSKNEAYVIVHAQMQPQEKGEAKNAADSVALEYPKSFELF